MKELNTSSVFLNTYWSLLVSVIHPLSPGTFVVIFTFVTFLFRSRLENYLFYNSFPPQTSGCLMSDCLTRIPRPLPIFLNLTGFWLFGSFCNFYILASAFATCQYLSASKNSRVICHTSWATKMHQYEVHERNQSCTHCHHWLSFSLLYFLTCFLTTITSSCLIAYF